MGDFNIDICNAEITNTNCKNVIELNDLCQLIEGPTRITAHSEKLIDHVYASVSSNVVETFVSCIAISDHYPVSFTRKVSKTNSKGDNRKIFSIDVIKKLMNSNF